MKSKAKLGDSLLAPILNFPITFTFSLLFAIVASRGISQGFTEVTFLLIGEKSTLKLNSFLSTLILLVLLEHSHRAAKVIYPLLALIRRMRENFLYKVHKLVNLFLIFLSINALVIINIGYNQDLAENIYSIYRINPIYPQFADLRTTLIAIECPEVNRIGDYIVCGDRGNNWTYPTILLMLRAFGVNEKNTTVLMLIVLVSLTSLIYYLVRNINTATLLYFLVLLNCPPFLIAIERGNLDLLIFTLLIMTLILLNWGKLRAFTIIGSAIIIAFASFLKFYPLFAFVPIIYISMRNIKRLGFTPVAFTSVIAMTSIAALLLDFRALSNFTVNDLAGSVGLRNIYALTFGLEDSKGIPVLNLLLFSTLILLPYFKRMWRVSIFYKQMETSLRLQLIISAFVGIIPLLLATNYYYRLILLFPLMYLISRVYSSQSKAIKVDLILYVFLPTIIAYFLVFRTFALLQNAILLPLYLLFFCFITHECKEITNLVRMKIRQIPSE
jgi:hypothetical protein